MYTILMLSLLSIAAGVSAAPVNSHQDKRTATESLQMRHQFAKVLHGLSAYKRKLQHQGLINNLDDMDTNASSDDYLHFNEIEILQMIPLIIDQLRNGQIDAEDRFSLHKLFGSMWPLIEEEAQRRHSANSRKVKPASRKIDPVLKAILRAQKFSHNTRRQDLDAAMNDDIAVKLSSTRNQRHVEPSQRILKMAARLIHEQMARRLQRKQGMAKAFKAEVKRRLEEQEPEEKQVSARLVRKRRSTTHGFVEDLDENQLSVLNSLIGEEKDDDDESYDDDAGDDEEEQEQDIHEVYQWAGLTTKGDAKNDEDDDELESRNDYEEYAFDASEALAEDDDALIRRMYGGPRRPPKNDGSIIELFKLATRHNLRRQRNSAYMQAEMRAGNFGSSNEYY